MEGEAKGKTFKMKGHTLPGINQKLDDHPKNVAAQGLSGSSPFQHKKGPRHKNPHKTMDITKSGDVVYTDTETGKTTTYKKGKTGPTGISEYKSEKGHKRYMSIKPTGEKKSKSPALDYKKGYPQPGSKNSPAKVHKPGHKKGISIQDFDDTVARANKKEKLLNKGFTQADADAMIKSGVAGAKAGSGMAGSYLGKINRLSKKYNKSPKKIKKILKEIRTHE